MTTRVLFIFVAAFWLVMNVLLWRAEFGRGRETLSEVPLDTVVERLLNAPDPSVLQIQHQGENRGTLRWIPTIEDTRLNAAEENTLIPEGMVEAAGYNLDLDLNLVTGLEGPAARFRILAHLDLDTNRVWQSLSLRFFQRPATWELTTRAGDDAIQVRFDEGKTSWEQTFRLRELGQLTRFLGPYASLIPGPLAVNPGEFDPGQLARQIRWSTRNDWLKVGRNRVRTYRVQATLFGRYELMAQLSRAGEILQVSLPDGVTLLNESVPFGVRP